MYSIYSRVIYYGHLKHTTFLTQHFYSENLNIVSSFVA